MVAGDEVEEKVPPPWFSRNQADVFGKLGGEELVAEAFGQTELFITHKVGSCVAEQVKTAAAAFGQAGRLGQWFFAGGGKLIAVLEQELKTGVKFDGGAAATHPAT